jgi:hypothetical protein
MEQRPLGHAWTGPAGDVLGDQSPGKVSVELFAVRLGILGRGSGRVPDRVAGCGEEGPRGLEVPPAQGRMADDQAGLVDDEVGPQFLAGDLGVRGAQGAVRAP